MRYLITLIILLLIIISSCTPKTNNATSAFEVYCEMVSSSAKPVALHYPMESTEIDQLWDEFLQIAKKHEVQLYREKNWPSSLLFSSELTKGKEVVLIYRGNRLAQYQQWKADVSARSDLSLEEQQVLARRLGRLLGYSSQGINELLNNNTNYRNLTMFNVELQTTHLYYEDLDEAIDFYEKTLGLTRLDSVRFKVSEHAFIELHLHNSDHEKGQAKSTAIALLTDQLPDWYAHLQQMKVPLKYTYKPKVGGPHDGFVAIDPGGYLLEFEQFKQHPENELFMAVLEDAPRIETTVNKLNFYGSITWTYHQDLLKMQKFYEEVLGFQMVANQGWTKIYQTSPTGFIGLVDERRGMEDYADTKAVEIEWELEDVEAFNNYAYLHWGRYQYKDNTFLCPEMYIYRVK